MFHTINLNRLSSIQIRDSTKCLKSLEADYKQLSAEKDHVKNELTSQVERLQADNVQMKAQLQDSQSLVKEQHAKCKKLSEGKDVSASVQ